MQSEKFSVWPFVLLVETFSIRETLEHKVTIATKALGHASVC